MDLYNLIQNIHIEYSGGMAILDIFIWITFILMTVNEMLKKINERLKNRYKN